jgi:hypothetical protein
VTDSLLHVAERLGVSVAVLAAMAFAFWRTLLWMAPRADKVIDTHCAFVEGLGEQVERQTVLMEQQTACMTQLSDTAKEHGVMLRNIHEKIHT